MRQTLSLATLATLAAASPAHAGNLDGFFIGNTSALMGGAVTAAVRTPEALWYNPAGLAGRLMAQGDPAPRCATQPGWPCHRNTLDVSASAFALRFRPMDDALATWIEDDVITRDLDDSGFDSVPTSLLFVRALTPRVGLGFGVVVPNKDRFTVEDAYSSTVPVDGFQGGMAFQQREAFDFSRVEYHAGVAVGWAPLDNLRVGMGLFVNYSVLTSNAAFYAAFSTPEAPGTFDSTVLVEAFQELSVVGGRLSAGLQWDITPDLTLGVQIRTPDLVFATFSDGNSLLVVNVNSTTGELPPVAV